jgi:hypothetical protein
VWKHTVLIVLLLDEATSALDTESEVSLALQKHCCIMQGLQRLNRVHCTKTCDISFMYCLLCSTPHKLDSMAQHEQCGLEVTARTSST